MLNLMCRQCLWAILFFLCQLVLSGGEAMQTIDLRPYQDAVTVLENPDKGLFHHYYDDSIHKYLGSVTDIHAVPGCRQLYIRLPWSVFEPENGRFDFSRIDRLVRDWSARGYTFSIRFTCKETSMVYATPEWVRKAGARGGFYRPSWGNLDAWEPEWDDPIFLRYLERFLQEAGRRYDGKAWLDYMEIGSIGDWGEGHTSSGSRKRVPVEVRRRHLELWRQAFRHTPLVIGDDFCSHELTKQEREELFAYALKHGLLLRDDSVGVDWWLHKGAAKTWSVARPEWFARVWPQSPTIVELQHYHLMKKAGDWAGIDGSQRGRDWLLKALDLCHPTWLGYHGDASTWLRENPHLTRFLANKVGYWLFARQARLPREIRAGQVLKIELSLENRGWAPPYRPWQAWLALKQDRLRIEVPLEGIDARRCRPGEKVVLHGKGICPAGIRAGNWEVSFRFTRGKRRILLACLPCRQDGEGWLHLGVVRVLAQ